MAIRSALCACLTTPFLILVIILVLNNATPSRAVEEFKVGDDLGWRRPINETDLYNVWAFGRKFHVGDLLRFVYYNDSVVMVDKWGYYHCDLSRPETVYTDGNNTLITLETPGPVYFVSGDPDHCRAGQRLLIEVLPLHPTPTGSHSPPPIPGPPEPFWEMSPAPSPLSNSGSGRTISSLHGAVLISVALPFLLLLLGLIK